MAIEKKLKDQLKGELNKAKDSKRAIVFDCLFFASELLSEVRELIASLPQDKQELVRRYVFKGQALTDAEESSLNFDKWDMHTMFNSEVFSEIVDKLEAYEEDQQRISNIKQYLEDNKTRRTKK